MKIDQVRAYYCFEFLRKIVMLCYDSHALIKNRNADFFYENLI